MKQLSRYAQIWLAQMRYSATRDMMFKLNFILWMVVEVIWFVLQLLFIEVVYSHVESVAGWNRYELILLVSVNQLIQQVMQAFLMVNLVDIPELVRSGRMDFMLVRPAPVQFLVSTRLFDMGALVNGLLALCICLYCGQKLGLTLTLSGTLLFLFASFCAIIIHYGLLLMLVSLSFWIVRAQGLVYAYYNLFNIARIPRAAFTGVAKVFFTFVIPMLLVSNVPSELLLGRDTGRFVLVLAVAAALLFTLSSLLFHIGLRRYSSASS